MMCRNLILFIAACLLLNGCVKHNPALHTGPSLLTQARKYFTDSVLAAQGTPVSYPAAIPKTIRWDQASTVSLPIGQGITVPIEYDQPLFIQSSFAGNRYFHLDNLARLLIYQDAQQHFHAQILNWLPDSNFLSNPSGNFSGFLFVDDWWGNRLSSYWYDQGQVRKYHEASAQAATVIQVCTVIYGYNYAEGDPDGGYAWEESAGCYEMYLPDIADYGDGGGGLGGGGRTSIPGMAASPLIFRPTNIIANIRDYLKCFQDMPGATFQVTACVDQPSPGTRTPWVLKSDDGSSGSGNPFMVGHSYLILTENMPGGWSITRNVGFYPSKDVTPFSDPVPGVLNDDEQHPFNIAAQYNINSNFFFGMLAYIANASGNYYQANTSNCTNFVLAALATGHIYLPYTIGSWIGGMGVDPGDLGEDIRNNNFTGMTRITSNVIHPNLGICD